MHYVFHGAFCTHQPLEGLTFAYPPWNSWRKNTFVRWRFSQTKPLKTIFDDHRIIGHVDSPFLLVRSVRSPVSVARIPGCSISREIPVPIAWRKSWWRPRAVQILPWQNLLWAHWRLAMGWWKYLGVLPQLAISLRLVNITTITWVYRMYHNRFNRF